MLGNIKTIINKLFRSDLRKNISTVFIGNLGSQIITIALSPILTRIFSPTEYGYFSVYLTLCSFLVVASSFRYEQAINLTASLFEAIQICYLSLFVSFLFCITIFSALFVFLDSISILLKISEIKYFLLFSPLNIFLLQVFQIITRLNIREKQFKLNSSRLIIQNIIVVITQIILGAAFQAKANSLIIGSIAGQCLASVFLVISTIIKLKDKTKFTIDIKVILIKSKEYKNFALFESPAAILNSFSSALPNFLLVYFFSSNIVGWYALGYKIIGSPLKMISNSLASAFLPEAVEANKKQKLSVLSLEVINKLAKITLVPSIIAAIIAPIIFKFIFGPQWEMAGYYSRWLVIWLIIQILSSPISSIYGILGKQRIVLVFNIFLFIFRFIIISVGGYYNQPIISVCGLSIISGVMYIVNFIILNIIIKSPKRKIFSLLIKNGKDVLYYCGIPILISIFVKKDIILVVSCIISILVFLLFRVRGIDNEK